MNGVRTVLVEKDGKKIFMEYEKEIPKFISINWTNFSSFPDEFLFR